VGYLLEIERISTSPRKTAPGHHGRTGDPRQSAGRYRIEEEMRRFSDSVGRRMTLLIDDLDRCSRRISSK